MRKGVWCENCYRRNNLDMHIDDWDERFLSRLDPKTYVEMLKLGNVKLTMVSASSHVGKCSYPTKVGRMHRGVKGRDVLGEIIDLAHKEGMYITIYNSLIYNNWAYDQHPEWRIVDVNGNTSRERPGWDGRRGVCCPNAPGYRKFVLDQAEELCKNYEFEDITFDMTFWPTVCYCSSCKARYKQETGEEIPKIIDWNDPAWVRFQRKREEWLVEFDAMATSAAKKYKPGVTVRHNCADAVASWLGGHTAQISDQCDYVGGDPGGSLVERSFIFKLYSNLKPDIPFDFGTPLCYPGLVEHTMLKPKALIEAYAALTIAHGGRFGVIDAIDPVGTLDERRWRMTGEVMKEVEKYEKYLGTKLCQDVAVYFSYGSKLDPAENGRRPPSFEEEMTWSETYPHKEAALGATQSLRTSHIPFGVISEKNLEELSRHHVVILPNLLRFSDKEAEAIRTYVSSGGNIYASKFTLDSRLAEMLGATSLQETGEKVTYITPTSEGEIFPPEVTRKYPLSIRDSQIKAEFESREGTLATITLPYTNPDETKFASVYSNPPGILTGCPAIIRKRFGKGNILYSSASIETFAIQSIQHRAIFARLIRSLISRPLSFEAAAPECVEIVQIHKPDEKRYLVSVVNFQNEIGLPNIPVNGIVVKVKAKARKVTLLPEDTPIPFAQEGEYATIRIPELQTLRMMALDYE